MFQQCLSSLPHSVYTHAQNHTHTEVRNRGGSLVDIGLVRRVVFEGNERDNIWTSDYVHLK